MYHKLFHKHDSKSFKFSFYSSFVAKKIAKEIVDFLSNVTRHLGLRKDKFMCSFVLTMNDI